MARFRFPAKQSEVISVDSANVKAALIDSGYYQAGEFTGLEGGAAPVEAITGKVGIVLPTKDEPRWIQDETRFREALTAAGYEVEILFSQGLGQRKRECRSPADQGHPGSDHLPA
jgi:ABC-type xylose transport system substrate-binding protein